MIYSRAEVVVIDVFEYVVLLQGKLPKFS